MSGALGLDGVVAAPLSEPVVRLVLAALLGMFMGLEREWSEKSAGVRTFALTSLVAAVFTMLSGEPGIGPSLLAVGAVLVVVQGVLLAVQGLRDNKTKDGLSLTTSVSLLVAYGVGALVAVELVFAGVAVAVVSAVLLVLKRELHSFAGGLSRAELRSTAEFAILAFVVYPLLPAGERAVLGVPIEPRVAWLMVVTVAGIGIVNYALVRSYGSRGLVVTGFVGGLASSTAVVGAMLDHVGSDPDRVDDGVAAVLLANGAMALRNLVLVAGFTVFTAGPGLFVPLAPLAAVVVGSLLAGVTAADVRSEAAVELSSPFSLRNVLAFGAVFFLVLVGAGVAERSFGGAGLYVGALLSGLVSSAGATTSAALLFRSGTIDGEAAAVAVLLTTAASIGVKVALAAGGPRQFARRVALRSAAVVAVGGLVALAVVFG